MNRPETSTGPAEVTRQEAGGPDLKLVAALLERNRKAAAEFVARYTDDIHAYVHRRLVPRADMVNDIVQDVFLAAWDNLHKFEGRSSLKSWLLGIARHKVESYYRTRLREPHALDIGDTTATEIPEEPRLEQVIDRKRAMVRTRRILEELPETYSLLLLWRYWEKRSVREMADSIGRTEKAVERALARARDQFRRKWEDAKKSESGK